MNTNVKYMKVEECVFKDEYNEIRMNVGVIVGDSQNRMFTGENGCAEHSNCKMSESLEKCSSDV